MFFRKARRIKELEKALAYARNDIQEIKLALMEARVADFIVVVDYVPGMKLKEIKPVISLEELQGRVEALERGMNKTQITEDDQGFAGLLKGTWKV